MSRSAAQKRRADTQPPHRRGDRSLAYVGRPGRDFDQGHRRAERASSGTRCTRISRRSDPSSIACTAHWFRAPPVPGPGFVAEHPRTRATAAPNTRQRVRLVRGERGRPRAGATGRRRPPPHGRIPGGIRSQRGRARSRPRRRLRARPSRARRRWSCARVQDLAVADAARPHAARRWAMMVRLVRAGVYLTR